jgi:GNAT superfamily N-acetyltransferase
MSFSLRPARASDAVALQDIESSTDDQFREIGLHEVADDPPDSVEELVACADAGRAWVAIDEDKQPIGYLLVDSVDGAAHIDQVTVRPNWQGRGVGRALIDHSINWARQRGLTSVTLTTFSEVPWNQPLYEHLGFGVLEDDEIGPGLRQIQRDEADKGFSAAGRVAMRLSVD